MYWLDLIHRHSETIDSDVIVAAEILLLTPRQNRRGPKTHHQYLNTRRLEEELANKRRAKRKRKRKPIIRMTQGRFELAPAAPMTQGRVEL
jgi:hypothetical protein